MLTAIAAVNVIVVTDDAGRRRSTSGSSGWPCSCAWPITAWRKNLLFGLVAAVALVAIARATGLAALPA